MDSTTVSVALVTDDDNTRPAGEELATGGVEEEDVVVVVVVVVGIVELSGAAIRARFRGLESLLAQSMSEACLFGIIFRSFSLFSLDFCNAKITATVSNSFWEGFMLSKNISFALSENIARTLVR